MPYNQAPAQFTWPIGMQGPQRQLQGWRQGRNQFQDRVSGLQAQLQRAQNSGAAPNIIGDIQRQLQMAQRQYGDWQTDAFANFMANWNRPSGAGSVGGQPGAAPTYLQQNPFLEMLLMRSIGGGGGLGGIGGGRGPMVE